MTDDDSGTARPGTVEWALLYLAVTCTILASALSCLALAARAGGSAAQGLALDVLDRSGNSLLRRRWPVADLEPLSTKLPTHEFRIHARLTGLWYLHQAATVNLWLKADGQASVRVDGYPVVARRRQARSRGIQRRVSLERGLHSLEVDFEPAGDSTFLKLQWATDESPLRRLAADSLFSAGTTLAAAESLWRARAVGRAAAVGWLLSMLLATGLATAQRQRLRSWPGWWLWLAVPVLLAVCAGALRFEALVERYWLVDAPAWALGAAEEIASLRPVKLRWLTELDPYRGDPFGYLWAAREPRGFYDAHVREPVFVFATKLFLWLTGGQDIAVNLASAAFSVLAVVAVYFLGASAFSSTVGFLAALLFALERQVITVSVEGWRDDAFTFFVVLSCLSLLKLSTAPTRWRTLGAGLTSGLACLTRITSLSFLLPGHAWLLLPPIDRKRIVSVASSLSLMLALLAPYLLACAVVFGDPLHSINSHTAFYGGRQGLAPDGSMSWLDYLLVSRRPVETVDTLLVGLTAYPFAQKWQHFAYLWPGLGPLLSWCAVAGLVLFAFSAQGRLLLVMLFSSLLPYAFTWDVLGGGERRFTLHAYPFYLIAGSLTLVQLARFASPGRAKALVSRWREWILWAAALALLTAVIWAGAGALLYLRVAETIAAGASVTVPVGARDFLLFGRGWRWPRRVGVLSVRPARGSSAALEIPLRARRDYLLTLRLGLSSPDSEELRVSVFLNGSFLKELRLGWDEQRMDAHRLRLPGEKVVDGRNLVEIRSPEGQEPGFVIWYFRLESG